MQSPEILLAELNGALRRLRGACVSFESEDINRDLLPIMRRLLLAEVLGNTWILAVGGSQGAGKTTLMSTLYDLRQYETKWLEGNEGRGENLPVLIIEAKGLDKPEAYVRRLVPVEGGASVAGLTDYVLKDVSVKLEQFQNAVCNPDPEDLLPVLRVPPRYFNRANQAWLLLPGYERQDRSNKVWQELMRQAMIAAGGCIVVTDETRMANHQQREIVHDMLRNELRDTQPCIVVTKTEGARNDPERQAALRASAQEAFDVPTERVASSIILTGSDDADYVKEWRPHLADAIANMNLGGDANRAHQLGHLAQLLSTDLSRVMAAVRTKALLYYRGGAAAEANGEEVRAEILESFDEAEAVLRAEHLELVRKVVGSAYTSSAKALDDHLKEHREGIKNWLSNALESTTETKQIVHEAVQNAWKAPEQQLLADYASQLSLLTFPKLGRVEGGSSHLAVPAIKCENAARDLVRLGYVDPAGKATEFNALTPEAAGDMRLLLGRPDRIELCSNDGVSKNFRRNVALIPALSLEYARIFYTLPDLVKLNDDFTPRSEDGAANIAVEGVQSLSAGVELGKTAVRALASVMAVDIATDGQSDILRVLKEQSESDIQEPATGAGGIAIPPVVTAHPAAIAAVAVVAVSYVTVQATARVRSHERKESAQAHALLAVIHDQYVNHLQSHFDKLMAAARDRISQNLAFRYKLDEKLMRKDRLAKAIADVNAQASDLRYELETSAAGLHLFNAEHLS